MEYFYCYVKVISGESILSECKMCERNVLRHMSRRKLFYNLYNILSFKFEFVNLGGVIAIFGPRMCPVSLHYFS